MLDAEYVQLDGDGRVLYRIFADRVEERPDDGELLVEGMRLEYRADEQVPWHVRAAQAVVTRARGLELEGGVELIREPDEGADRIERIVVRTERARLEPERHFVSAPGEVMFLTGTGRLTAIGLKAFLKEDRVELESNGHGHLYR